MEDKIKKVLSLIKNIKLSPEEKSFLHHNVDAYIANNPVDYEKKNLTSRKSSVSPYFNKFSFVHLNRYSALAFAAVFILAGGTSIAANQALPNEALYNVKVNVNEEVRSWFVFGAERQAYFETDRANARLEEAKELAVKGELTKEAKDTIQKNFKKHTQVVKEKISEVRAEQNLKVALEISENFENSLEVQVNSLAQIESEQNPKASVSSNSRNAKLAVSSEESPDTTNDAVSTMSAMSSLPADEDAVDTTSDVADTNIAIADLELSPDTSSDDAARVTSLENTESTENVERVEDIPAINDIVTELGSLVDEVRQDIGETVIVKEQTQKDLAFEKKAEFEASFTRLQDFITLVSATTTEALAHQERIVNNLTLTLNSESASTTVYTYSQAWAELDSARSMADIAEKAIINEDWATAFSNYTQALELINKIENIVFPPIVVSTEVDQAIDTLDVDKEKDGEVAGASLDNNLDTNIRNEQKIQR
jgi:hypothetical protein